ncbi:MAG: hypothetical protein Q8O67_16215 [Deltaproteobacteria bacterium]|nr:hypothetical protein [Deltaproteobacteria bacterium]
MWRTLTKLVCRSRAPTPTIFPFADDAAGLLFGGPTLSALQEEAAGACGLQIVDVDDDAVLPAGCVAFLARDVVLSGAALQRVLDLAQGRVVRASVKSGTALHTASTRLLDVSGDLAVPLWAGDLAGKRPGSFQAEDVVVADEDAAVVFDTSPLGAAPHTLAIADVERLLGRATHWLHVLDLSLAAARTRLRQRDLVRQQHGKRRPRIHPTAYVDNSILGAGVRIDAHVSVIDSVLGDDVNVADHTVIHGSVIGAGCRTLVDTHLRRVVAMPGSTLSNLDMQDAIFGREVFVTTGVAFFDEGPGKNVVVDGRDSGRAVLGGAIGARSVLGSRALFRSGVALPARLLVVARPEEAIGKIDEASMARAAVRFGDRARDV